MQGLSTHLDFKPTVSTILIVLLLLVSSPLYAEWHKDYESAIEMLDTGNFNGAIPKLQAAVRQKNEEGANIKFLWNEVWRLFSALLSRSGI